MLRNCKSQYLYKRSSGIHGFQHGKRPRFRLRLQSGFDGGSDGVLPNLSDQGEFVNIPNVASKSVSFNVY